MLPKNNRLKREKDFKMVFKEGRPFFSNLFIIKIGKNNLENSRFAFVVSTKISKKAVVRNKIRRQLREIVRLKIEKAHPGFDVVVIVKKEILDKEYEKIEKELLWAFEKIGIFK